MINDANEYATSIVIGIAELAELLGTSKSSLRYYEQEGLVTPERAEESGYRRYSIHSLVELTDILFYRNMGVPVKDVRHLLDAPVEETEHALDEAEDELLAQIETAQRTLRLIAIRRRKIRTLHELRDVGPRLVDRPGLPRLYTYAVENKDHLSMYLNAPQEARFSVMFPREEEASTGYLNCTVVPIEGGEQKPVWSYKRGSGPWMECLLETGYDLPDQNNLARLHDQLRGMGHEPGCTIAEYLTFGADSEGVRRDYYHAWVEAL